MVNCFLHKGPTSLSYQLYFTHNTLWEMLLKGISAGY